MLIEGKILNICSNYFQKFTLGKKTLGTLGKKFKQKIFIFNIINDMLMILQSSNHTICNTKYRLNP